MASRPKNDLPLEVFAVHATGPNDTSNTNIVTRDTVVPYSIVPRHFEMCQELSIEGRGAVTENDCAAVATVHSTLGYYSTPDVVYHQVQQSVIDTRHGFYAWRCCKLKL